MSIKHSFKLLCCASIHFMTKSLNSYYFSDHVDRNFELLKIRNFIICENEGIFHRVKIHGV